MRHSSFIVSVIAMLRMRFAGAWIDTAQEKTTSRSTAARAVKGMLHAGDNYPDVDKIVEQQPEEDTDNRTADGVGHRLGGYHFRDLPALHADSAHGSVLLHPCRHAH